MQPENKIRCPWVGKSELLSRYHDLEWGQKVKDDLILFEFIILEGAQAGLNWLSILSRREAYREAFFEFDPVRLSRMKDAEVENLMSHPGIIRNRAKIKSTRTNASCFLQIQHEYGSFYTYLYGFMPGGNTITNHWEKASDVPVSTAESILLSKDMKKKGFAFFGPVICYAFMQATGMVNDHLNDCFLKSSNLQK